MESEGALANIRTSHVRLLCVLGAMHSAWGRHRVRQATSDAHRHITLASQRRTANEHTVQKDGLFLTTFSQQALGRSAKEGTAVRTTKMMPGHFPTAARMAMWGGDKGGSVACACGATLTWEGGKVAHLQNRMCVCVCAEERTVRVRWATAVRTLAKSAVKHDRAGEVADAVAACWGADGNGGVSTAAEDELRGWTPTETTHDGDDEWHISGTTVLDEHAHWGGPAPDEPDGDERHEQGHVRAPSGVDPTTRTGTGLSEHRAEWPPRFACCIGYDQWWTPRGGG